MQWKDILHGDKIVGSGKVHCLKVFLMMFATWLVLSGHFEAKYIIMGLGTAIAATWLAMPVLYMKGKHSDKYYFVFDVNLFAYVIYWVWLLNEVRKASMDVATSVMRPEMDIDPKFFGFRVGYDNPMAHATLANSITLTPGTITLHVTEDGEYAIHSLTSGAYEGLLEGGMQERIAKLFGEAHDLESVPVPEAVKGVV